MRHRNGPWPGLPHNDYFILGYEKDIPDGKVVSLRVCNQDLVVFRNPKTNRITVMDAYCRHLGAHLGSGGTVTPDGCVQCPFHGWKYDADGCVQSTSFDEKPQQPLSLRTLPIAKVNGMVLAWMGDEPVPDASSQPKFLDTLRQVTSLHLCYTSSTLIRGHIRDIMENGCDLIHFSYVHADVKLPKWLIELKWDIVKPWHRIEGRSSQFTLGTHFWFLGKPSRKQTQSVTTLCNSSIIIIEIFSGMGHYYIVHALTPIDQHRVVDNVYYYSSRWMMQFPLFLVGKLADWTLTNDFQIWANKKMLPKPLLQGRDGNIHLFRRWYNQFLRVEYEST